MPDGRGVMVIPGDAVVIGYYNAESTLSSGVRISSVGGGEVHVMVGSCDREHIIDMDVY